MNEQPQNIPKYYLPPKTSNKKTLVLDLDETLVHSQFFEFSIPSDITIKIEIEQEIYDIHVLVRPGVEKFIEIMKDYFEIIIFTASISKYADILMNIIDPNNYCPYRLFREHCSYINNNYVKDLTKLGRNLKDIIIVDNSPLSYSFHPNNGLPILSWFDDYNDFELEKITPILIFLSMVDDVREYIPKLVKNNEISYIDAEKILIKNGFVSGGTEPKEKNDKIEGCAQKEKITKISMNKNNNKNKKSEDKNKNIKKGKKFNINIQIVQNNINNINNIIEGKQNKEIKNKIIKYLGIINNTEQKNALKQKQPTQNNLLLKQKNIISNISKPNTVINTQSNNKDVNKKGHKRQNTFNVNLNNTNFIEKYKEKHFIKLNNINNKIATKKSIKEGKNNITDNKSYFQHIRNILNKKRKRIKTPNNINTIAFIANNIKYNFQKYKSNLTAKSQKRNKSNKERTKLLLPLESSEHIISKHICNLSNISNKGNITNNNKKRNYNKIEKIKIVSKYKSISNRKSYGQNDFLNISINTNNFNFKNRLNKIFKGGQKLIEPHHQKQKSYNEINFMSKFRNNLMKGKEIKKNIKSNQTRLNTNVNEFKNRLIKRAFGNFKKINLKNIDFIAKKDPKKIQINFNYKNNENTQSINNNHNNKNIYSLYKTIDKSERKKERENTLLNNISDNLMNKSYRKISHQKTISYNMNSSLNISNILNPKNKYKNKYINNFTNQNKQQMNKQKSPIFNKNIKSNSKTLFANRVKNNVNIKHN